MKYQVGDRVIMTFDFAGQFKGTVRGFEDNYYRIELDAGQQLQPRDTFGACWMAIERELQPLVEHRVPLDIAPIELTTVICKFAYYGTDDCGPECKSCSMRRAAAPRSRRNAFGY